MAMTGGTEYRVAYGTPPNWPGPINLYLYVKVKSQDIITNRSEISLGMYFTTPHEWGVSWTDFYGSYIGLSSAVDSNHKFNGSTGGYFYGTKWLVENVDYTVYHNADGTCSLPIYWKWGVNSGWAGVMEIPSGVFTVELPAISRPSIPTFSTTTPAIGSTLTIYTNRKSPEFTHIVEYNFAGVNIGVIDFNVENSVDWQIPMEFAASIPSATSGDLRIVVWTYYGNEQIGSNEATLTAIVPDNDHTKPTFDAVLRPSGSPDGFADLFLQAKSSVKVEFEARSQYSTIASYAVTVNGVTVYGNPSITAPISTSGDMTVTCTVTDARGFAAVRKIPITVIPYGKPKVIPPLGLNNILCERCDSNGIAAPDGEYLHIKCGRQYSTVVSVVQRNFCEIKYQHKVASSAGGYSGWITILPKADISTNYVDVVVPGVVTDIKSAYTVQIAVEDDIKEMSIITLEIPAADVPLHLGKGGRNVGIGQYCDYSSAERVDIGWPVHFNAGIAPRVVFTGGSWANGQSLTAAVPAADTSSIENYTLFLASIRNGGSDYPVLFARAGNTLAGNFNSSTITMAYADRNLTLSGAGSTTVTALYELL